MNVFDLFPNDAKLAEAAAKKVKEDSWHDGQNAWSSDQHEMVEGSTVAYVVRYFDTKSGDQGESTVSALTRDEASDKIVQLMHERGYDITVTGVKPALSGVDEGSQDFNRVEPYEVCLAGEPVKTFDYYEQARKFHDNWKKKLYREGNKAKADKITLNPIMKETATAPIIVPKRRPKEKKPAKFHIPYTADDYVPPAVALARDEEAKKKGVAEGITYNTLNIDNQNLIDQKAKSKPDGLYTFRGIMFRVRNGRVTHYAAEGTILVSYGNFNSAVGSYSTRDEAKAKLKNIKEGVAEGGIGDEIKHGIKGIKRKVAGKPSRQDVKDKYWGKSLTARSAGDNAEADKNAHRYATVHNNTNSGKVNEQGVAEGDETSWTANSAKFVQEEPLSWSVRVTLDPRDDMNKGRGAQVKTMKVSASDKDSAVKKVRSYFMKNGWAVTNIEFVDGVAEALSKNDLLKQVGDKLNDPEFRKKPADPNKRWEKGDLYTGPGKDDPSYSKNFGHGYPDVGSNRSHNRDVEKSLKKKGVAEGDEHSDVEYLARAFADAYYSDFSSTEKIRLANDIIDRVEQGQLSVADLRNDLHTIRQDQDKGVAEGGPAERNRARGVIGHGLPWKDYDNPDELARDISEKILTITNIVKLNNMAYDSTIYRSLEKYFEKYGYPESVFNRVASIVFKRLDDEGRRMTTDPRLQQGVAEGWKQKAAAVALSGAMASAGGVTLNPNRVIDGQGRSAANPYGNVDSTGTPIKKPEAKPADKSGSATDKEKSKKEVKEAETDYSKRRARERDVDAGRPVAKQRQSKMTDYQKRRAQDKRDMELGESTNYWTKLQAERSTKLNTLVTELTESIKDVK